jgi:hypothetical protein
MLPLPTPWPYRTPRIIIHTLRRRGQHQRLVPWRAGPLAARRFSTGRGLALDVFGGRHRFGAVL